jgi:HK97 family phage prohead protease
MENNFSQLELNIKAIEAMGLKVKHNPLNLALEKDGKSFFQLKDIDSKKGIVAMYFAAFGNKDSDGDIIQKGAYTKTFKENKQRIKHLYNHDKTKSPGVGIEFGEDNYGAYAVSQLAPTTLGKDVLIEYEAGIITEHSQGFQTLQEHQSKNDNANIMTEIKLWEFSSLTAWGANQMAVTIGVKDSDIDTLKKNIETVLRSSSISDERGKELEVWLKELLTPKPQNSFYKDILKGYKS